MSELDVRLYTPSEAARRLVLTPARVRQLMAQDRLPYRRTPLGRLLDADAVDALAVARTESHRHDVGAA